MRDEKNNELNDEQLLREALTKLDDALGFLAEIKDEYGIALTHFIHAAHNYGSDVYQELFINDGQTVN